MTHLVTLLTEESVVRPITILSFLLTSVRRGRGEIKTGSKTRQREGDAQMSYIMDPQP